ncbi:Phosphatidylglycerol/phosphatidylinositol transfer protein [Erysiphe necator]|nr:Phosphatidylglycerol/phosphatidylinositol transfer protein [Erysiphe necator]
MKFFLSIIPLTLITLVKSSAIEQSIIQNNHKGHNTIKYPVPGNNPLQYCDSKQTYDVLQIKSLNFTVEERKSHLANKENKVYLDLDAEVTQNIEAGATVEVLVTFARFIIFSETIDLCDLKDSKKSECPILKGPLTVHTQINVPKSWLQRLLTYKAKFINFDQKRITCVISDPLGGLKVEENIF